MLFKTLPQIGSKRKTFKKVNNNHNYVLGKSISSSILKKKEFPYYNLFVSKSKIVNDLKNLSNYKPQYLRYNPIKRNLRNFQDRLVIFKEDYDKNKELYRITEYFSQQCRMKCINNLKSDTSPFDYYEKNKDKMFNDLSKFKEVQKKTQKKNKNMSNTSRTSNSSMLSYEDINEYLYSHTKMCTNFRTTIILSLLKFFNVKKYLDPSAGWGDRLIGAIAYGCEYTGVDPSVCMNPIYHQIIRELVPKSQQDRYQIIQSGFEVVEVKENYYDLVFTSPPFFDFELYENNNAQSISQFNTLDKWLNGFLYKLIEKSHAALVVGGHLGLYISDYTGVSFTDKMLEYVKKNIKGFEYQGDIHFWDYQNKNVVRSIFFWKKV